jgi:hypothetical protein
MANVKFVNLTVYLSSSVTETIKKQCKAALKQYKIHDHDWDEVRDISGRIIALTVFIKVLQASQAKALLLVIPGVINVVVGELVEPVCVISAPAELSEVSGIVTLQSSVLPENKNKVKRIDYIVGDTLIGSATATPYSVSWDTLSLPNGLAEVKALGYDKKGKLIGSSVELTVTIANVSGLVELVGTEESFNVMRANPNVIMFHDAFMHETFLNGVATMTWGDFPASEPYWGLDTAMLTPIAPAPLSMEIKIKETAENIAAAEAGPYGGSLMLLSLANGSTDAVVEILYNGVMSFNLNGANPVQYTPVPALDPSEFHVYKLEVTPENILFSIDGTNQLTVATPPSFDIPEYNWTSIALFSYVPDVPVCELEYAKWSTI